LWLLLSLFVAQPIPTRHPVGAFVHFCTPIVAIQCPPFFICLLPSLIAAQTLFLQMAQFSIAAPQSLKLPGAIINYQAAMNQSSRCHHYLLCRQF
jgi:hypothetical protein